MKARILLILALGALALSLFENWRYRVANKDFKALFEAERAETTAALYSSWVYNDAWSVFLNSSLLSQGFIRFSESRLSSSGYADKPNEREPSVSIRFSIEKPFTDIQTQELNEIVSRLQAEYDGKVKGLWRIRTVVDNGALQFYIFANAPITDAKFSRFGG